MYVFSSILAASRQVSIVWYLMAVTKLSIQKSRMGLGCFYVSVILSRGRDYGLDWDEVELKFGWCWVVVEVVESQDSLSFGPQNKTEWALILNGSSNFQSVERAFDYY